MKNVAKWLVRLIAGLLACGSAQAAFVVAGIGNTAQAKQASIDQFLTLLNDKDVTTGGTWTAPAGRLMYDDDRNVVDNEFATMLNALNNINDPRTLLVGSNISRVLFGAWGDQPGMRELINNNIGPVNPQGVQVVDVADFSALWSRIKDEPVLDITASVLIHELSEASKDGAVPAVAHQSGMRSQNDLLRREGSSGVRLEGDRDAYDKASNWIGFDLEWFDSKSPAIGWERFLVTSNYPTAAPYWVARGLVVPQAVGDSSNVPTDVQFSVADYFFVPEPNSIVLIVSALLGLMFTRVKRAPR